MSRMAIKPPTKFLSMFVILELLRRCKSSHRVSNGLKIVYPFRKSIAIPNWKRPLLLSSIKSGQEECVFHYKMLSDVESVPMTLAYNLPDDIHAIRAAGSKLVMMKNLHEAKFH